MKTPEEMYYEWRQAFDESLDERMCKGEPIELQLLHQELGKETFLAGYKAAQQWISVKDRLPDVLESVLVLYAPTNKAKNDYRMECWNWPETEVYEIQFISHWQPLPAPPKEEK